MQVNIGNVKKRGEFHLAFAMYKNRPKTPVLTPLCSIGQTIEKPSVYKGVKRFALSHTSETSIYVLKNSLNL